MNGYVGNIEKLAQENNNFRQVVYTAEHCQLVLMSLQPDEEIGLEVHDGDQFLRFESGEGKAILDGAEHLLKDGDVVIVPAGTRHNIINTSASSPLKLYTIYAPPHHKDKTVHATRQEAESDSEHFDGVPTESNEPTHPA